MNAENPAAQDSHAASEFVFTKRGKSGSKNSINVTPRSRPNPAQKDGMSITYRPIPHKVSKRSTVYPKDHSCSSLHQSIRWAAVAARSLEEPRRVNRSVTRKAQSMRTAPTWSSAPSMLVEQIDKTNDSGKS